HILQQTFAKSSVACHWRTWRLHLIIELRQNEPPAKDPHRRNLQACATSGALLFIVAELNYDKSNIANHMRAQSQRAEINGSRDTFSRKDLSRRPQNKKRPSSDARTDLRKKRVEKTKSTGRQPCSR